MNSPKTPEDRTEWRVFMAQVEDICHWFEFLSGGKAGLKLLLNYAMPSDRQSLPEDLRPIKFYTQTKGLESAIRNGSMPDTDKRVHIPHLLAHAINRMNHVVSAETEFELIPTETWHLILCNGDEHMPTKENHLFKAWLENNAADVSKLPGETATKKTLTPKLSDEGTVRYFPIQTEFYDRIAQTIEDLAIGSTIRFAHIANEISIEPERNKSIDRFIQSMEDKIRHSGPNSQTVLQIYSVSSFERAKQLEARVTAYENPRAYRVKFWPTKFVFPSLSPLIVGEKDVFVATDDPSSPHRKNGLHIRGEQSVKFMVSYFDSFFADENPGGQPWFMVRSERGIHADAIEKFYQQLNDLGIK